MRLAPDRTTITLDGRRHVLRPTLRAAMRLEASLGMEAIFRGLNEGSVTTMAAVIRETADLDHGLTEILDALSAPTLAVSLDLLREPLTAVVFAMCGYDPDAQTPATDAPKPGKMLSIPDYLASLYRMATGWLYWTPAVAWSATRAEIEEACKGRIELLNLINGGKPEAEPEVDIEDKFAGFAASLRARKALAPVGKAA